MLILIYLTLNETKGAFQMFTCHTCQYSPFDFVTKSDLAIHLKCAHHVMSEDIETSKPQPHQPSQEKKLQNKLRMILLIVLTIMILIMAAQHL